MIICKEKLLAVSDGIANRLKYFDDMFEFSQLLNSSNVEVHSFKFSESLKKLDDSITFLSNNVFQF